MSRFPKQKRPHNMRVLQDWIRGAFDDWLETLDDALAEDIEGFSFSREEPERIRNTTSYRVNIVIDYKGRRWGKVPFEGSPETRPVVD